MAEIENHNNSHSDEDASDDDLAKKSESGSDAEIDGSDEEEEYAPKAKAKKPAKAKPKKRKGGSDDDSDGDWNKKKPAKKGPAAANGKPKKVTAFTKSFKLSPALADVVGSDVMPRHEVVKNLWKVIKERELQDPKNKQFAICDDQLMKVFGVKRFRTFGMMKHLKDHFLEAA